MTKPAEQLPKEEKDEEWVAEIERRARAAIAGEPGIPWEEVRAAVKRRLGGRE